VVRVRPRPAPPAAEQLGVEGVAWSPESEPAPAAALAGRDAVVHLAGENVAQRWSDEARQRIRASREQGTRNLVAGLRAADPRPGALIASSAVGIYGDRGDERLEESASASQGFLADVCVAWERETDAAADLGLRVVKVRTGVVLDASGGALKTMLPPFKLGVGGPIAGGKQYIPWIHADDIVGMYLAAIDNSEWTGAVNGSAPEPATNRDFSKALGRALHRPAVAPVPALAIKLLYGEMAEVVTGGQRAVPARALELGYSFEHPELDEALRSALQ
jgi:uncharacterized protein (TIGR01777 family)